MWKDEKLSVEVFNAVPWPCGFPASGNFRNRKARGALGNFQNGKNVKAMGDVWQKSLGTIR